MIRWIGFGTNHLVIQISSQSATAQKITLEEALTCNTLYGDPEKFHLLSILNKLNS